MAATALMASSFAPLLHKRGAAPLQEPQMSLGLSVNGGPVELSLPSSGESGSLQMWDEGSMGVLTEVQPMSAAFGAMAGDGIPDRESSEMDVGLIDMFRPVKPANEGPFREVPAFPSSSERPPVNTERRTKEGDDGGRGKADGAESMEDPLQVLLNPHSSFAAGLSNRTLS